MQGWEVSSIYSVAKHQIEWILMDVLNWNVFSFINCRIVGFSHHLPHRNSVKTCHEDVRKSDFHHWVYGTFCLLYQRLSMIQKGSRNKWKIPQKTRYSKGAKQSILYLCFWYDYFSKIVMHLCLSVVKNTSFKWEKGFYSLAGRRQRKSSVEYLLSMDTHKEREIIRIQVIRH